MIKAYAPKMFNPGSFGHKGEQGLAQELRFFYSPQTGLRDSNFPRGSEVVIAGNPQIIPSPFGPALAFDGTTDRLDWSREGYLETAVAFRGMTLAAKILVRSLSLPFNVFSNNWDGSNYRGVTMYINTGGTIEVNAGDGAGTSSGDRRTVVTAAGDIVVDTWYTVACSLHNTNDFRVFINGRRATTETHSGTASSFPGYSTGNVCIGARNGSTQVSNGWYAWVGYWGRSLTADEHMRLHINPLQMFRRKSYFIASGVPSPTDSGSTLVDLQPSSTDKIIAVDTGSTLVDLQPSGTEIHGQPGYTDSGSAYLDLEASGVSPQVFGDSGQAYEDLQPSSSDRVFYTDSGTRYYDLQPGGSDTYLHAPYTESATILYDLQPSGTDEEHECLPRFDSELISWNTPLEDGLTTAWDSTLQSPQWSSELLEQEEVINHPC